MLVLHLASLSTKILLLGGIAWIQLFLLRRAPASSRSRICSVALIAILFLAAGEMLAPTWIVKAPVITFTATAAEKASPSAASATLGSWLALIWLAGAGFMLLRAFVGRAALSILRRRFTLPEPAILLQETSGVDVRIAEVRTPILVGLLRPAILLPEAARTWTDDQRRMVLIHELTHFRQGDCWTNLLAQIIRAAFWFHPVVWLLVSRMSREQELTCDEAVVASGHSPQDYAAFLLDAVRNLHSREMFACAMAGSGARSLTQRFARLLDPIPRPNLSRRVAVSLILFVLFATALTVVRPVWSQGEQGSRREVHGPGVDVAPPSEVYKVGGDVTQPSVLRKVEPQYSEQARKFKISGPVHVSLIVTAEGQPDSIEVTDGLGYGLDENAIDAISQWTFQPATKEGKAVAVRANVLINFRLL